MDTNNLDLKTVGIIIAGLILTETARTMATVHLTAPVLLILGVTRLVQSAMILGVVFVHTRGLAAIGLHSRQLLPGMKMGLVWSAGFGLLTAVGFGILQLLDLHPLTLLRVSLPAQPGMRGLFFLVGGIVAPIAEEIFFRGILYGYFRRWGVIPAVCFSTLLFSVAHSGVSMVQASGGLLFAIAYEMEKKLTTPMVIHAAGNLALFSLSAWMSG
ncbi:MAG: CPBP family intramembrane glutamic endopeptidase [Thermodesulfobacteriota bacterium]